MKFTLTFDGELPSNGKVREKWAIRKQFHPQLEELWRTHPAMAVLNRYRNSGGGQGLCDEIQRGDRKFLPLIQESLGLRCALKILFLRKEEPGRVYQGGDMDNRLKTLFDALAVPSSDQIISDPTIADPIYCLCEDDGLISGCNIETHRLLSRPNSSPHEVHLVVEVDVRISFYSDYNAYFLGE